MGEAMVALVLAAVMVAGPHVLCRLVAGLGRPWTSTGNRLGPLTRQPTHSTGGFPPV
jgi:hypothetical protein